MSEKITIEWCPDKNSNISLVDQIVFYIKERVHSGDWISGSVLPSQRKLAEIFEVNRSTIVESLSRLCSMGITEAIVGKGTAITSSSWSFLMSSTTPDWNNYISKSMHQANIPTIQKINKYEFDESYIRLSTGEISPDLMPHDAISKVHRKLADLQIPYNYLEPLGLLELRNELSIYLKKYNLEFDASEILIVSGSLQALQLISVSILGSKSCVLVEENTYIKSLKVFEFAGINMSPVPTDKDGAVPWLINESKISKGNTLFYTIPTFHNPTGLTMSQNRRMEVLDWCKRNKLPIIEDDAYRELYFKTTPPSPIKSQDESGNVLYMGSVSKSLAPGFRIGWIVGPKAIIERLGDIKMQTDYGASSVSQWLLTHLIRDGHYEKHLNKLRKNLEDRCEYLLALLNKHFKGIATWNRPLGGFYIWLKLKDQIVTEKLFEICLKHNILINPGYIYGFKKNNYIRLSYSYPTYNEMDKGIEQLASLIKDLR